MAEPIGVTAGLLGIATFAFQTSKAVYDLVNSIQKAPQTIRDLKSELLALDPILSSIHKVVTSDASKFEDIRYPLHQCGMVCFHLRSLIQQCTAHSAHGSTSARDWVKMQYKGKTVDGYKGQLASYKATIGLAVNLFTLANTALAAEAVDEMKRDIYNTINQTEPDLEVHIEEVTEGLDSLAIKASSISHDRHTQSDGDNSLQVLERQKSVFEEDRLALEAEKKAIEQSQQACKTARQWLAEAALQLGSGSVHVNFSGANNSGFQLGQNTGVISNLQWGAQS
ncbi:hypothetical protein N7G274_009518 [Stereocaulon virgatum]|uniref:Fungal N-terminal domain-containing protein n=1 Tax=Stereocaulon virgatum TaxID=373712 RepID=A0ABR4A394_9LECA